MRSRVRVAAEWALRAGALLLLAAALWSALNPAVPAEQGIGASAGEVPASLPGWTLDAPAAVHLSVHDSLSARDRDWLVALRRAGTPVTWSGDVAPIALAAEAVNEPAGGTRVLLAGAADMPVSLRDAAGPLDSLTLSAMGGAVRTPAAAGRLTMRAGGSVATVPSPAALRPRRVLVIGAAGWEAKYAIDALEEAGWMVDARLAVAPGIVVRRGRPAAIDTATYAAIIALDSTAARDARDIAAFVRRGGGAILAGAAAGEPALRAIAPGRPTARVKPALLAVTASAPRRALGYFPVGALRPAAVVLEERDGRVVTAAQRSGAGRVVQTGEDESWRWRMQGGTEGPAAHRAWWSRLVGSAALRLDAPTVAEPWPAAPRAAIAASLGQPRQAPDDAVPPDAGPPLIFAPWMLLVALSLLLVEWTSRRLRGAA